MLTQLRRTLVLQPRFRGWRRPLIKDVLSDGALALTLATRANMGRPDPVPTRVLVASIVRAHNESIWRAAEAELRRSRHRVTVVKDPGADQGKFGNLNRLLKGAPEFDWLVVLDDDVLLPEGFLDLFILACERFGLRIAQPAHRHLSFRSWPVTGRRPFALARVTNFVEIGPVTAFHRIATPVLLPFPTDGMGWGLDGEWSRIAEGRGWPIGVIDVTPIAHLGPVASTYDAASQAGSPYLGPTPATLRVMRRWPSREVIRGS